MKNFVRGCLLSVLTSIIVGCEKSDEDIFSRCSNCMVHLTSDSLTGTGFLVADEGGTYVYTCEHCVLSTKQVSIRHFSGKILLPRKIYVAVDRDLVRFSLRDCELKGLPIVQAETVKLKDEVVAVGDSQGVGAMTTSAGSVLGIGAAKIEIDAKVQHGNSGGPVMTRHGKVIGAVATGERSRDEFTEGTRFDELRYFAVRVDNVQWHSMCYDDYVEAYAKICDMRAKCSLMVLYLRKKDDFIQQVEESGYREFKIGAFVRNYNEIAKLDMEIKHRNQEMIMYNRGVVCRYMHKTTHEESLALFKRDLAEKRVRYENLRHGLENMFVSDVKKFKEELKEIPAGFCGEKKNLFDVTERILKELNVK